MPVSEFDLIRRYFATATPARDDVLLGIGDDCALLAPPPGRVLAVSTDTLVAGRHFLADADPCALGHKSLAVNLSDLAAMGAEPAWVTLALTLPSADTGWLEAFVRGFAALAGAQGVQLVGGDTTRGPLSITIQVHGFVAPQAALRRGGARAGDRLFVSGSVGGAALALRLMQRRQAVPDALRQRLNRPQPRVALGRLLAGRASAAIDVSDGLVADLRHVCEASGLGARIALARLPLLPEVAAVAAAGDWSAPLAGGDDYELLFTLAPQRAAELVAACADAGEPIQEIGYMADEPGVRLIYPDGRISEDVPDGFDHFKS
ncbi:MAG: thiamine-phosphate kinase [Chromatiaceae bacterium]|nr:thiamine-phosphate kinase [Chromatiaceae bacterium]